MRCHNQECSRYDFCPQRDGALQTSKAESPSAQMIHSGPGSTFEVRAGQIGVLTLAGRIEEKTLKAALALVAGLSQLRGVLAIFDTPGGSGTCADLLREIVLFARDRVPVFALVRQACSAGLLIATACGHILAEDEDDSTMGCFGAIAHFCDGHTPQLLCSRQAPQKIPVGRLTMGPLNFSRYDEYEIEIQQNILDRHFDVNIARISQLRGVPIDVLLEIFTGETFTGRTARYYGLVDGYGDENEAIRQLNEAINSREIGSKTTTKSAKKEGM